MSAAAGGGVDVLDAMALSSQEIRKAVHDDLADYLDEARAAVAELIAADKGFDEANEGYSVEAATPEQIARLGRAVLRRRAALSNIEGGQ